MNSKLVSCKDKPFIWYNMIDEICGTNVATGNRGVPSKAGFKIENHVSLFDSSDSNRNASQELNDFNLREFRNSVLGVDLNLQSGGSVFDYPTEDSPTSHYNACHGATSGAASGSSSGKRARECSVANECDNRGKNSLCKKSKVESNKSKQVQLNSNVEMILDESRERRKSLEELKNILLGQGSNRTKEVVDKLLNLTSDGRISLEEFLIVQEVLAKGDFIQELFLSMNGDVLDRWLANCINNYHAGK